MGKRTGPFTGAGQIFETRGENIKPPIERREVAPGGAAARTGSWKSAFFGSKRGLISIFLFLGGCALATGLVRLAHQSLSLPMQRHSFPPRLLWHQRRARAFRARCEHPDSHTSTLDLTVTNE